MNENNDPKKPFVDAFRKQKEELERCLENWKKLEKDASGNDKRSISSRSPLLESVDDLVHGDLELPSTTIKTAVETVNEYIKALNEFSEDQFEAFLMGVGANWLNLPYWGIPGLKFQCKKIEESLTFFNDVESDVSDKSPQIFEKLNPNRILPIYNPSDPSKKLLNSEILAEAPLLFKSMLQVLSGRSF